MRNDPIIESITASFGTSFSIPDAAAKCASLCVSLLQLFSLIFSRALLCALDECAEPHHPSIFYKCKSLSIHLPVTVTALPNSDE
jgi:hypothetical protein